MSFIQTQLSYVNEKLTTIPEEVFQQPSWNVLNLSGNNIQQVDQRIASLTIGKLCLSNNPLIDFPKAVLNIKGLKELHLKDVNLRTLPAEIEQLQDSLEVLNLSGCNLETLPKEIGSLKNLKVLQLEANHLKQLPVELANLKKLERIDLNFNDFQEFPEPLLGMTALKEAYLGHNRISAIPSQIDQLSQLTTLGMAQNRLQKIPPQIGKLQNIQILILSFNQIQTLPQRIGNLKSLKELLLRSNQLRYLPIEINKLSKGVLLNIEDNPIDGTYSTLDDQDKEEVLCSNCGKPSFHAKSEIKKEQILKKNVFARTILCEGHA